MAAFTEKRSCPRFSIPGAMISYGKFRLFRKKTDWLERSCLVIDISRGGVRFLTRKSISMGSKLFLELSWPEGGVPVPLLGAVRWTAGYPGDQFRHYLGVQFRPYGSDKKYNPPEVLDQIVGLENRNTK